MTARLGRRHVSHERRLRPGTLTPMLFAFFVVAPLVELLFAVEVAHAVGWGVVVVWIGLAMALGYVIARHQGVSVWRRVRAQLQNQEVPGERTSDAFLKLVAGILILLPGLLSDAVGLLLLLPPVRAVVRERYRRRWTVQRFGHGHGPVVDV